MQKSSVVFRAASFRDLLLNEKQKERFVSLNYFDATKKGNWPRKRFTPFFVRNPSSISLPALLAYDDRDSTIMDKKSWGTNLQFLRFCAHGRCEYKFTCLTSSTLPHIQCRNLEPAISLSTLYWARRVNSNAF